MSLPLRSQRGPKRRLWHPTRQADNPRLGQSLAYRLHRQALHLLHTPPVLKLLVRDLPVSIFVQILKCVLLLDQPSAVSHLRDCQQNYMSCMMFGVSSAAASHGITCSVTVSSCPNLAPNIPKPWASSWRFKYLQVNPNGSACCGLDVCEDTCDTRDE